MKKIFYLITIILLLITNVYAVERTDLDNLGVNKRWNINEYNRSNVLRTHLVDASEKIYDYSNVLTEEEKANLKARMDEFIQKYDMDIAILIDSLPYTIDSQNEDYAADFYDYNDFGLKYKNYDGILLFRNTYELDPYYDIYTFGEAQLYFGQDRYDELLDGIYDNIKSRNYYEGFDQFLDYVNKFYEKGKTSDYVIDDDGKIIVNPEVRKKRALSTSFLFGGGASFVVALVFFIINLNKNKLVTKVNEADSYLDTKSVNFTKMQDILTNTHVTHYTVSSSSGGGGHHGGGGFHSSGGSSGGFHSSGGGRHG